MSDVSLRFEWIIFENAVLNRRREQNMELRAEAFEAFVGGMGAMFKVFTEMVPKEHTQAGQQKLVNDLHDQLRVLALEAGRQ